MPYNLTSFLNSPFNTTFGEYTNLFQGVTGNGQVFWLFILIILTIGVYIKTQKPIMASMFMISSSGFLSSGYIFTGAYDIAMLFVIFTAIGITGLFIGLIYFRGE